MHSKASPYKQQYIPKQNVAHCFCISFDLAASEWKLVCYMYQHFVFVSKEEKYRNIGMNLKEIIFHPIIMKP